MGWMVISMDAYPEYGMQMHTGMHTMLSAVMALGICIMHMP